MSTSLSKLIPVILIMAMLVPAFAYITQEKMTNTANALVPTYDIPGWVQTAITAIKTGLSAIYDGITSAIAVAEFAFNKWVQYVFKVLLEYFKLKLLDMLSTQIVNWITNGALGNPQYITNWQNFLGQASVDALNITINEVDKASGGLICTPFANQLRNLLRANIGVPGISGFQYSLSCSLDRIVQNINAFYLDFSQGGWAGYLSLMQPNNNYYGNVISILDFNQQLEAAKQRAAQNEGIASLGYIGVKRCKVPTDAFGPGGCAEWEVTTPGKALAATVDEAVTNRFGYIFGMDQFASIIAILVDSTLNKLIGVGVNGLFGYAASYPSPSYISPTIDFTNCTAMTPGPQQDACFAAEQAQAPDVTLSPSVTVLNTGDTFSLIWAGINTTSCTGTNFNTNGQNSGNVTLSPTVTTSYSVTCTNANGQTVTKFTTVTVEDKYPFFTFTASPASIKLGDSVELNWEGEFSRTPEIFADACVSTNFDTKGQGSGFVTLSPAVTTTYSVTCVAAGGLTATRSLTVTVN